MIPFFAVGDGIGPYSVVRFLGRGSFGVVLMVHGPAELFPTWSASVAQQPQYFAMKLVPCDHVDDNEAVKARARALAEANLMRRLRHPHIVSCHEVHFDAQRKLVWLLLDFMDGGDLDSLLKNRRGMCGQPFEGVFLHRSLAAVGGALRYIHAQGVLHRDVKPANVLLSRGGHDIKLADFGVSKLLEVTAHAGTILGTPAYMSPEIVSGQPYGPPSDAWGCGACIYELASLRRPFEASNQLALVIQIVEQAPPELPSFTPRHIVFAVIGLLEKDPLRRLRLDHISLEAPSGFEQAYTESRNDNAGIVPTFPTIVDSMQRSSGEVSSLSVTSWAGHAYATAVQAPPGVADGSNTLSEVLRNVLVNESGRQPDEDFAGVSETTCNAGDERGIALHMPDVGPHRSQHSDLEEELLQDVRPFDQHSTVVNTRATGLCLAFGGPVAPSSPRYRNWFNRIGLGLRRTPRGETTAISAFNLAGVDD